ncbi:hypothetical protein PhCBS80983_g04177 [Powellomyces hirtus]|uniref:FUN14 domain-containing protein n=1 Tax=Powellomyces hirtus TaxID=109895 RepID=A0A507DZY3_9FUNG|nr:hypothetical protein PhCBS80983_g04177 [Powellomyces hirtus]
MLWYNYDEIHSAPCLVLSTARQYRLWLAIQQWWKDYVILSTLAGSSAVASAAVWMAPEKTAPRSPPDILLNSEPLIDVAALETLPPPPEGWFRAHLRPELMTMGGALGAFTGFFTKKVGKMVAFIIGGGFVLLQFLAHAGFITISWSNVQKSFNRKLNTDANGQVPPSTVVVIFKRLLRWLTADIPFTGGFIAGFWIGFRFG